MAKSRTNKYLLICWKCRKWVPYISRNQAVSALEFHAQVQHRGRVETVTIIEMPGGAVVA